MGDGAGGGEPRGGGGDDARDRASTPAGPTRARSSSAQTTPIAAADLPRSPVAEDLGAPGRPRLSAGTLLARRYRIERFVAAGGMGEVYEATDVELRTRLAVKTVRAQIEHDPEALDRVRREVQLARAITDPGVCRIFDIGHADVDDARVTFITMELLEGETLHARLRDLGAALPEAEALPLATDLLRGLAAVHRAGVVHRDLKAENVMLVQRDGRTRAVITDFGIARAQRPDGESSTLTEEGVMIGSPAFMAPEQINGSRVTARADVYAAGAILWELAIGPWPLRGEETVEIVRKVAGEFPRAQDFPPGSSPRWAAVIQRCRRNDPARRFATADDVLAALTTGAGLEPVAAPVDPAAPPPSPHAPTRSRRRALGLALLAAAAGGGAWWALRARSWPTSATAPAPTSANTPATGARAPARVTDVRDALRALDLPRARALAAALPTAGAPDAAAVAGYWQARVAAAATDWDAVTAALARARAAPGLTRPMRLRLDAIEQRAAGDLDAALASQEALYALTPDDPDVAMAYAEELIPLGKVADARAALDALAATPAGADDVVAARILLARATALTTISGADNADLERTTEATRVAAAALGATVIEGRALGMRALARLFLGRTDEAVPDAARAVALLEAAGDAAGLCHARRVSAVITYNTEVDLRPVLPIIDRTVADCARARDELGHSLALNVRGGTLNDLGELELARAAYQASIDAAGRAHRLDAADKRAGINLGVLNMDIGKMNAAEAQYADLERRNALDGVGLGMLNMSELARYRGDLPLARTRLATAVAQLDASRSLAYRSTQYVGDALLAFEAGKVDDARAALRRAEAAAKASATGSADWGVVLAKARVEFGVDRRAALSLLEPTLRAEGLTIVVQGLLTYLTARAQVAAGQRAAALALRDANAGDPRWPRYHEVQLMARLLDAELASTPAERTAAATGLQAVRTTLRDEGFTTARWEAELGLAALARASGDAAGARAIADATAREAGAAGYARIAALARAAAGGR